MKYNTAYIYRHWQNKLIFEDLEVVHCGCSRIKENGEIDYNGGKCRNNCLRTSECPIFGFTTTPSHGLESTRSSIYMRGIRAPHV